MFFTILGAGVRPPADAPANSAYLRTDYWDDWGKYRTMFTLVVVDDRGLVQEIGSVKIGEVGLKPSRTVAEGERAPSLPPTFDRLDDRFFSVGQGEDYYAALNQLAPALRQRVLEGLNDCAFNLLIFDAHLDEYVMGESLLRDVRAANVRGRLNRLSRGDAQLTEFRFNYTLPHPADVPTATLTFEVVPESHPPTNVHVLIGRNGVGKTRCMRQLALALLGRQAPEGESYGEIALLDEGWAFAGVILISFSAFDSFDLKGDSDDRLTAHQVGLRHHVEGQGAVAGIADALTLAQDFRALSRSVWLTFTRKSVEPDRAMDSSAGA